MSNDISYIDGLLIPTVSPTASATQLETTDSRKRTLPIEDDLPGTLPMAKIPRLTIDESAFYGPNGLKRLSNYTSNVLKIDNRECAFCLYN